MTEPVLVASRMVLSAEDLRSAANPMDLLTYAQQRVEADVQQLIAEQGLQLTHLHIRWECHVQATCEPARVAATPVQTTRSV